MTTAEIIAALGSLSVKGLKSIRSEADRLLLTHNKADMQLYQAMTLVLGSDMKFSTFERTSYFKLWLKNEELLASFVRKLTNATPLDRKESLKIKIFLITLIRDRLVELKVEPSMGAVTSNMLNVEEIFNRNFPGYIKSGLATMVVKMVIGKGVNE